MSNKVLKKIVILIGLACLGFIVYGVLDQYDILSTLQDGKLSKSYIASTGLFGPLMVILFMTLAILVSPTVGPDPDLYGTHSMHVPR
jgi:uncharacterized membrane protein YdjX (TVP38/TMEM64 family)